MSVKVKRFRLVSTASTNLFLIETGKRDLETIIVTNTRRKRGFVKIFDLDRPPILPTDTPALTIIATPLTTIEIGRSSSLRIEFELGIAIAITTSVDDYTFNSTKQNDIIAHIFYR